MASKFEFRHHVIDTDLPPGAYAQTALVDLDGDGQLEFVVGQRYGNIYGYKYHVPDRWERHVLGQDSPSDVGACAFDVDGDGHVDIVTGGAWFRNPGALEAPFTRTPFDEPLEGVHDVAAGDLDGDGRTDLITMSDRNNLRWYRIPDDPTQPWTQHDIGPAVHAGVAVGDLDGDGDLDRDGDLDIFSCEMEAVGGERPPRYYIWENLDGNGDAWQEHVILDVNLGGHDAVVGDVTGNGLPDILAKPWRPQPNNALGGKMFIVFLENVSR